MKAENFGATAVKRFFAESTTVKTMVQGLFVLEDGKPIAGVEVMSTAFGETRAEAPPQKKYALALPLPSRENRTFLTVKNDPALH